jgi:replication factor C subunit 2/4
MEVEEDDVVEGVDEADFDDDDGALSAGGVGISGGASRVERFFQSRRAAGSSGGPARARPLPWVEKYRPSTVADVASQEDVKRALARTLETGTLPNLLFYGPPGTGKTSTILALAHELFGPAFRDRVLDLNASDERGIAVVRTRVKAFAELAVAAEVSVPAAEPGAAPTRVRVPPYKLIVLDEADSMTDAAQAALRRLMETHARVTRFCILCNYVSRIIDPVASRCAKFRFQPLARPAATARLLHICAAERVRCDPPAVDALYDLCAGDMRRMITTLQSLAALHRGPAAAGDGGGSLVTHEHVLEVAGFVPAERVAALVAAAPEQPDVAARMARELLLDGYSAHQLVVQLAAAVADPASPLANAVRLRFASAIADADKALTDGADELLQLLNLLQKVGPAAYAPAYVLA